MPDAIHYPGAPARFAGPDQLLPGQEAELHWSPATPTLVTSLTTNVPLHTLIASGRYMLLPIFDETPEAQTPPGTEYLSAWEAKRMVLEPGTHCFVPMSFRQHNVRSLLVLPGMVLSAVVRNTSAVTIAPCLTVTNPIDVTPTDCLNFILSLS